MSCHLRHPSSLPSDYTTNTSNTSNTSTNSLTSMLGYFHAIWEDALQQMGQPNHQKAGASPMNHSRTMGQSSDHKLGKFPCPDALSSSLRRQLVVSGISGRPIPEACFVRQRFADVCFMLDCGGCIQAHRVILAARCWYFRSMLDGMLC